MTDNQKNIITNILGLLLLLLNCYAFYWRQLDLIDFCVVLCLSLALFLFKANNTKLWLKKALKAINEEEFAKDRSILITIDDAYSSVFDYAWPILKKHNFY